MGFVRWMVNASFFRRVGTAGGVGVLVKVRLMTYRDYSVESATGMDYELARTFLKPSFRSVVKEAGVDHTENRPTLEDPWNIVLRGYMFLWYVEKAKYPWGPR